MVLDKVSDVDPNDPDMKDLELLASKFGLFNMTTVMMKVSKLTPSNGTRMAFYFDETTYRDIVATFIACAALNFASFKHEFFTISINPEMAQKYKRSLSPESHREHALKYLAQANELIRKFENA